MPIFRNKYRWIVLFLLLISMFLWYMITHIINSFSTKIFRRFSSISFTCWMMINSISRINNFSIMCININKCSRNCFMIWSYTRIRFYRHINFCSSNFVKSLIIQSIKSLIKIFFRLNRFINQTNSFTSSKLFLKSHVKFQSILFSIELFIKQFQFINENIMMSIIISSFLFMINIKKLRYNSMRIMWINSWIMSRNWIIVNWI